MIEGKFNKSRQKDYLEQVQSGCGLNTAARKVGCSPQTVWRFRKQHPEFEERIAEAETLSLEPFEDAVKRLALGDEENRPNLLALMYYLGNRSRGRWVDVRKFEPKQKQVIDPEQQRQLLADPLKLQAAFEDTRKLASH